MRYFLQDPDGNESEVTPFVLRAMDAVIETAFDLESAAVPSDFTMELDNSSGAFDSGTGLFAESNGERTKFLVIVSAENREEVLFIGTVTDTKYTETSKCEIETSSVIASLLGCSFSMTSVSTWNPVEVATPARLVADLLGANGLQLPGVFIDGAFYDLADAAEQNIGLEMRLEIPAGERISFTEFLQELNRTTGAYVHSYRGFMRYARQGGFDRPGFDYSFSGEVLAGSVRSSRPVLWQKTKVVAKYWDGTAVQQIEKTMSDYFDTEGDTIMERFREKVIESDGLGGKLVHNTLSSAEVGLQDVLGWRGRPRWDFEFEVDAIAEDVRGRAQGIPLLSRARLVWDGGCVQLAVIERTTNDQKTIIKGKSLLPPTFVHPAKRLLPVVSQVIGDTQWFNNTPFEMVLYYMLSSETHFSRVSLPISGTASISNPARLAVTWKIAWGIPCGEIFSSEQEFTPPAVTGFILGVSELGDTL